MMTPIQWAERCVRIAALLVCLTLAPNSVPVASQGATRVAVIPEVGNYQVGELIDVEVWVEEVIDLYGADIQISFDKDYLEVIESQLVPSNDLLYPDSVLFNVVDNEAGELWYVVTQLGPREPVSGSGVLFSFTFRTLQAGQGTADILEQTLANHHGELIPAEVSGAVYWIEMSARVFLPFICTNP